MTNLEAAPSETTGTATDCAGPELRVLQPRTVPLGGIRAMPVQRTLPHRELSLIGAWCFLDQFASDGAAAMEVLPHPHTALQTVTWPFTGTIRHRDSLSNDLFVKPGELNLMTAGRGVSHSEFSRPGDPLEGVQLWLALPTGPDRADPDFENVTDLPVLTGSRWRMTVFIGELAGASSPAKVFSPLVGAEGLLEPGATLSVALNPGWEHGILLAEGEVTLDEAVEEYHADPAAPDTPALSAGDQAEGRIHSGHLAYLGLGRESLDLVAGPEGARIVLIGGQPFAEPVVMFWNFIGRTHEDVAAAARAWSDDWATGWSDALDRRYGLVPQHGSEHIPGPDLPPVRLRPRRSPHVRER